MNWLQCVLVLILGRMSCAPGAGNYHLRVERGAGTLNSGCGVLREAIKGDALLRAFSDLLVWSRKTS